MKEKSNQNSGDTQMEILIISTDEAVTNSLARFINYNNKIKYEKENKDKNNFSLGNIIKKLKEKKNLKLIIIDDFFDEEKNEWGGLPLLKFLKTFYFPYNDIEKAEESKDESNEIDEKKNVNIIPILFLCADEIWRLEEAILRAGNPEIFGENESFVYHLNITKSTFFLKIPFEIKKLKEIINLAVNIKFLGRLSIIKLLSAAMGYEKHYEHH